MPCNVAGYILAVFQPRIFSYLTLEPYYILHGQIWRIVTWLIIPPAPWISLRFLCCFCIIPWGKTLEHTWGTFRFNVYMFSGVLFTVLGAFLLYGVLYFMLGTNIAFGQAFFSTYYVNMSIFLAFAACYPNMEVLLYFLFPVKIKYMGILYGIFIIYEFINSSWVGKVAILASLLNFLIFFFSTRNFRRVSPERYTESRNSPEICPRRLPRQGRPGTAARCAAERNRTIPGWSSATAPNARVIMSTVRITCLPMNMSGITE